MYIVYDCKICIYAGEMDETLVASQPPDIAFHPSSNSPQPPPRHPVEGESGARNGGQDRERPDQRRQTTECPPGTVPPPSQSARDFFAKLDWGAGDSGYTAFGDESDSDSDGSSSSSDEDEEMFGRAAQLNHNHSVHTDTFCATAT